MGLIAQRLAERAELRHLENWPAGDDDEGTVTSAGVRVTRQVALGLTTIWRCWDLITHAVAQAPTDVVVKVGQASFEEYTKPSWLTQPDPSQPNYTGSDYFADLTLSMLHDGNYFVSVIPDVYQPEVVTALDPARCTPRPDGWLEVRDAAGKLVSTLSPFEHLHGWWLRFPGELRGVSPLEALRRGIGSAVAAEEFASRFFGQGAALSFGVEVPYAMDETKMGNLRSALRAKYVGLRNTHAIGVLSDGGKFVTGLAPTPEQAQMLATRKFSVEDLCRPYGVPPMLAGSQEPGASSYASALVWREGFRDDAVLKFTDKLERGHARLLRLPDRLADAPGASVALRFNLDGIARTNLLERYQAHREGVQGGFITPNEARAKEDRAPLPGGDQLYMQQQMVPIGSVGREVAP